MPPEYGEVVNQYNVYLTWADNHPHEPKVNGSLNQARICHKIIGVNIRKLGIDIEPNGSHDNATKPKEIEEESGLQPPVLVGIDLEHLGNVLAVVVDVASQTFVDLHWILLAVEKRAILAKVLAIGLAVHFPSIREVNQRRGALLVVLEDKRLGLLKVRRQVCVQKEATELLMEVVIERGD